MESKIKGVGLLNSIAEKVKNGQEMRLTYHCDVKCITKVDKPGNYREIAEISNDELKKIEKGLQRRNTTA